jgi:L-ascorbate metabolism protein UlaG (beta-lactamase superfamily)
MQSRVDFYEQQQRAYQAPATAHIYRQMAAWMESVLSWVEGTLAEHPPAWPEPEVRIQALCMLDDPLHVLTAPFEGPVLAFLNRLVAKAVDEIEAEQVASGATIWKLYNMGFVIKTAGVTLGFDPVRGAFDRSPIEEALFDRLLRQVQALFVTHCHKDHASAYAFERMIERGRPVVTPPGMWADRAISGHFYETARDPDVVHQLVVNDVPVSFCVYPGHQDETDNNVYVLDLPGDLRIVHSGDQANEEDWALLDRVHERFRVDVLLANCWRYGGLLRLIQGVRPRLVITGHENELFHFAENRLSYALTHRRLIQEPTPSLGMTWGERYHYEKGQLDNMAKNE